MTIIVHFEPAERPALPLDSLIFLGRAIGTLLAGWRGYRRSVRQLSRADARLLRDLGLETRWPRR